jgi:hypothetical protein
MYVATILATGADRSAGRYRVVLVNASGDTLFNRAFAADLVRIPASEIDEVIARRAQKNRPPSALAEMRRLAPAHYPPFVGAVVGNDGTVWVRLRPEEGRVKYLVLDATGNPIGQVQIPGNVLILNADRQRISAVETNNDGLRSLVDFVVLRG